MITPLAYRAFQALKRYSLKPYYSIFPPAHIDLNPMGYSPAPGDPNETNRLIYDSIVSKTPFLVSRLGAVEARACARYYINNVCDSKTRLYFHLYKGYSGGYPHELLNQLTQNAGVFPVNPPFVDQFCSRYLQDLTSIDLLGSFNPEESLFANYLCGAKVADIFDIEPFFAGLPWTLALKGQRVLVVHPFTRSISYQYRKHREQLFQDKDILPEFELLLYRPVQSVDGEMVRYQDWFQALQHMIDECLKLDFDVAIIGCGAYGLPLASALKQLNKPIIHLGGVTQILFGIRGKRWQDWPVSKYFNGYWTYPSAEETPIRSDRIEGACYWK